MKITLWNEKIDEITTGESYSISSIVVRNFEGNLELNTTAETTIKHIPCITDLKLDTKALLEDRTQKVRTQQVFILEVYRCQACYQKLEPNSIEKTARCPSCLVKQRVSDIKKTVHATLVAKDEENNLKKYSIPEATLSDYLKSSGGGQELLNDPDRLEDFLLNTENLNITHGASNDAISKMEQIK